MDVALDGRRDDGALLGVAAALFLFSLDERHQVGHGDFHDAGAFHHLGQEHLARPEEIADHVHAVHQRPFDDLDGALGLLTGFLSVLFDEVGNAIDQRVL